MTGTYAVAYGGVPVDGGVPAQSQLAHGSALVMGGGIPYDDNQPEAGRCHHVKADGGFCMRYPKKGSMYCPPHKRADEALDFLNEALEEG